MSDDLHRVFNRTRLDDKKINELVGIARGLTADSVINLREAEYLQRWLAANAAFSNNPVISNLLHRVNDMLVDRNLDADESRALLEALQDFSGGEFKPDELLRASTLPLDNPPPLVQFEGRRFALTGTFAYGARKDCERAIERRGGLVGYLTVETDYLVVGSYATEGWAYASYGGKIDHALELKGKGVPLAIIGEPHWVASLNSVA